jgi:hypothetical protein
MFNLLVIICLSLSACLFYWSFAMTKSEIHRKSDEKSDARRAEGRKHQDIYRKEYWIRRNRNNLWDEVENFEYKKH